MQNKKLQEERLRKEREAEELALFKAFVRILDSCIVVLIIYLSSGIAKRAEQTSPTASSSSTALPATASDPAKPPHVSKPAPTKSLLAKKDQKSLLKGVVIKKKGKEKPKPKDSSASESANSKTLPGATKDAAADGLGKKRGLEDESKNDDPDPKKSRQDG